MRRRTLGVIAVLTLLLAATSVSDAHGRHSAIPQCVPKGSEPVAADAQAEVYAVTRKFQGRSRVSFAGCVYGSSRLYQLGHAIEDGTVDSRTFALAGPIVAYTTITPANASVPETLKVIVLNLSTGQILHHQSFPPSAKPHRSLSRVMALRPGSSPGRSTTVFPLHLRATRSRMWKREEVARCSRRDPKSTLTRWRSRATPSTGPREADRSPRFWIARRLRAARSFRAELPCPGADRFLTAGICATSGKMGRAGIEPATLGLRGPCSAG